jgi:hypothetical protein
MPLWQVSWSHCANPSPERQRYIIKGDWSVDDLIVSVINPTSNFVLETPWGLPQGRFDSREAV